MASVVPTHPALGGPASRANGAEYAHKIQRADAGNKLEFPRQERCTDHP